MMMFQKLLGIAITVIGIIILAILKDGFGFLMLALGIYLIVTNKCWMTPPID